MDKRRPLSVPFLRPRPAMPDRSAYRDPEVKPPEYRVPRGRSGLGAQSALETLLNDLERIRRAKEAYGDMPLRHEGWQFRF
jgi:hypothetical protein